jgi:hypothetical protein
MKRKTKKASPQKTFRAWALYDASEDGFVDGAYSGLIKVDLTPTMYPTKRDAQKYSQRRHYIPVKIEFDIRILPPSAEVGKWNHSQWVTWSERYMRENADETKVWRKYIPEGYPEK